MEKRVIIGTSMVLLAIAIVGFAIYLIFYYEPKTPVKETLYDKSLAEPVTYEHWDATWEAIYNSDASYLLDPDFDVTADNFQQCFYDFLATPARLYFYIYEGDSLTYYKCDSLEARAEFADIFREVSIRQCSEEEYNDRAGSEYNTQIFMFHVGGTVDIHCYHDYSCVMLGRYDMRMDSYTSDYFYVEENLYDKAVAAYEKLLPYSMEAPMEEVE